MFLAMQSYCTRLFSILESSPKGFIYYCIPNASVNRLNKDPHSNFPELVIHTRKVGGIFIEAPSAKGKRFSAIDRKLD